MVAPKLGFSTMENLLRSMDSIASRLAQPLHSPNEKNYIKFDEKKIKTISNSC